MSPTKKAMMVEPQVITDPREVAKEQAAIEKQEALRRYRWRKTFETEEGQQVLLEILDFCHMFQPTLGHDARHGAFLEGERNVGLRMCQELREASPTFEALILKAAVERSKPINPKENES